MSNINIPTQVSPFASFAQFPTVGKTRVIYIDQATNEAYYWNLSTVNYISLGGGASSVDWGSIGGDILDQTDLQTALSGKVDKVTGKGLSTNDYTTTEKNKLAGIEAGAQVNVNADWNATTGDAEILNKPTIPTQTSDLTNDGENGINPFITAGDIPGSLPPSGSAGGDLTGTYPNPTVHRIHGIDIQNGTPSADDVLVYGGSPAKWQHQHLNASQVDNDSSVTGANVELALEHLDSTKQPLLVSATNIKTINGSSLLGSGDLVVSATANPSVVALSATDGTAVTGTVADTISRSLLIPANTFTSSGMLEVVARVFKTGTVGNQSFRIYKNTSNTLTGATLIGSFLGSNTSVFAQGIRTFRITSNTLTGLPTSTSAQTDYATNANAEVSTTFTTSVDNYILLTIQLGSAADSSVVRMARATKYI